MTPRSDPPPPLTLSSSSASPRESTRRGEFTLTAELVRWVEHRIAERVYRPGSRLPSIRAMAKARELSRFTVVAAYERLVALGHVESRRGSGFYVRERRAPRESARAGALPEMEFGGERPDVHWLMRNMFRQLPEDAMPGSGLPPADWLDGALVAAQVRAIGRQGNGFLPYGDPRGFLPLRGQLALKLSEVEIGVQTEQILTTLGATQAFDLVARLFVVPGDTVFVDDPAWFWMFGLFGAHGAKVVGVPRLADGPDTTRLEMLFAEHRPKFYVVHSVLHNPTSTSLSAAKAHRILNLAQRFGVTLIEDDVYGDLHPGARGARVSAATRLASLDQLASVIYIGSFSKTLGANLRVGFIAADPGRIRQLADLKMLTTLTSPELGERVVYRVLSEGHYRKHLERLRERLDAARGPTLRALERIGLAVPVEPSAGMFLWARVADDARIDTNRLAARMLEHGFLLAPGNLFSPTAASSAWLRFNIATSQNPRMLARLAEALEEAKAGAAEP